MNKLKLFIDNFLVYGLGGIISKLIPLLMIPLITRLMPSTEYVGISDLSNTVVQFASALAIMGMYDAMYRMFFEKEDEEYKKRVCSTALMFTLVTSLCVFIVLVQLRNVIAQSFFGNWEYAYVVYLSAMATFVGATNSIVSAPTRMQNKRGVFLITNTLAPLISYAISIPMLLAGHYIIALPLAALLSGAAMEIIFGIMNRSWFSLKRFDKRLLKQMLAIAIPLLPNFLIYWVFNSSNKLMISNMIGIGAEGVYSVGSKLGQASQLIYTAFAGGWQYFAFSTMKENDQVESNSRIFEYLGVISFVSTMFVCAVSHTFFQIMFPPEYLEGYIVAPYLFLAPLLQMLFQVASNQFLVTKKTWPNMLILGIGALAHVLINLLLIPVMGIEGAALATLCGYTISNVVCVIVLTRMKLMAVRGKFYAAAGLMALYLLVWRCWFATSILAGIVLALAVCVLMVLLYRADLTNLLKALKLKGRKEH